MTACSSLRMENTAVFGRNAEALFYCGLSIKTVLLSVSYTLNFSFDRSFPLAVPPGPRHLKNRVSTTEIKSIKKSSIFIVFVVQTCLARRKETGTKA